MKTVKEFPYLLIIWDDEINSLILQWRGGFSGRNIREGLEAGLEEYKKHLPQAHWIGDTTNIGVIGLDDQTWIEKEWYPKFLATRVKFMAVVQPSSAVSRLSINNVISRVLGTKLTVFNCATLEEARQWIKKQKS